MNKYLKAALAGARDSLREAPGQYFAPYVFVFRWLGRLKRGGRP